MAPLMAPLMARPIHPPPTHDPPDVPLPPPLPPLLRQQRPHLPLPPKHPPQLPQSHALLLAPPHEFLGRGAQSPLERRNYIARDFENDNSTDSSSLQTSLPLRTHHLLPFPFLSLLESPWFEQVYISPARYNHSSRNVRSHPWSHEAYIPPSIPYSTKSDPLNVS